MVLMLLLTDYMGAKVLGAPLALPLLTARISSAMAEAEEFLFLNIWMKSVSHAEMEISGY